MTKEELKNKISMALKDPILQQGFECICKENAELKEVHESDKRSLALIAKKGADFEKAYNEAEELLDKQIEATYKLFEENKELKEQIGDVIECFTSSSSGDDFEMAESAREVMEVLNMQCYRHGKVKSKLTEAKEIICEYVRLANLEKEDTVAIWQLYHKAEDFLKECE